MNAPLMMTKTPPGVGIAHIVDFALRRVPDKVALVDDAGQITFGEIDRQADRLVRSFREAGLRPGDRAAIILPNSIPFIVSEVALLRCAAVKVPLNIRFHFKEVLYALGDCRPTVVVCDENYGRMIGEHRSELPSLKTIYVVGEPVDGTQDWRTAAMDGEADGRRDHYRPPDPILIRYTGGTTGRPKGIVHTELSYINTVLDCVREFAIRSDDVALHLGHLSHGLNFMWPAFLSTGACQVLRERFEPKKVFDDFTRQRITFVYMVPTMVQRLLKEDDGSADVSSLRTFLYASAPMPVPVLREAIRRFGNVFMQVYTLSESPVITTVLAAAEHVEKETSAGPRLGSCGRPVVTMEMRLIDDEGRDVERGEVGQIAIRSINNMAEYWNLPDQTAETLVDGWVRTGDMARQDEEGFYYLVDRKKDVIITGAFNVYPKEVEDVLYLHPAIAHCAAVGVPDEEWGEIIKAFVVLRPNQAATADELIELCKANLAGYKKPRQVVFVESLPLSPVGKVMRRALRDSQDS
jgi:fatty-acyl-CoA synthase/long-chain acyl-CoA synthetase